MYSIEHTYIYIFNISIFFIYRYSFERWPEILVIHMKRFAPTGSYRAKLTSNIHAPLRNLDLRYLLIYYFTSNLFAPSILSLSRSQWTGYSPQTVLSLEGLSKGVFFSESPMCFSNLKISNKKYSKTRTKGISLHDRKFTI